MTLFAVPLSGPPFCIIQAGKQKSRDLAEAVIAGYGGGCIHYGDIPVETIRPEYTPVVIGLHPTTVQTLHNLRAAERPFVTVDNGYFRPYKEGGYFRATANALQWTRLSDPHQDDYARFEALKIDLKPVREDGDHVLVALQSPDWLGMMGVAPDFVERVLPILWANTGREIIVRHKPLRGAPAQPPLEAQLRDCWAVVAFSSNVLIKAAIEGIPVFSVSRCAAGPLGTPDVERIERPHRDRLRLLREDVFANLAANQWTIEEIAAGRMWRDLQSRYEPEFPSIA